MGSESTPSYCKKAVIVISFEIFHARKVINCSTFNFEELLFIAVFTGNYRQESLQGVARREPLKIFLQRSGSENLLQNLEPDIFSSSIGLSFKFPQDRKCAIFSF